MDHLQDDAAQAQCEFMRLVESHRDRAHQLLSTQTERIRKFDQTLDAQFLRLTEELTQRQVISLLGGDGSDKLSPETQELLEHYDQKLEQLDAWEKRLQEYETQLDQRESEINDRADSPPAASPPADGDSGGLWLELEEAKEELDAQRSRNQQLISQLADSDANFGATRESTEINWEEQKSLMLAGLNSDSTPDTEKSRETRHSVEEAIRITDLAIAQRDEEIENLKTILQRQSGNIGSVAIGATAITDMLEDDELIQQERENLRKLQDEWRQKLRQAEVDTSLERAKVARGQNDMQVRLEAAEKALTKAGIDVDGVYAASKEQPRGWKAKLGIAESDIGKH